MISAKVLRLSLSLTSDILLQIKHATTSCKRKKRSEIAHKSESHRMAPTRRLDQYGNQAYGSVIANFRE